MISICIPVYNGGLFIEECIDSILKQTFTDFELLISNDCSIDNTLEIIKKYTDKRIEIFSNDTNVGWVKNCNILLSKAKGFYYCIIPCDDLIPENYIESLYNKIITDDTIINCYPYICTFGLININIDQKSILDNSVTLRIKDFILNHFAGVSFRGLVKKTNDSELLYLPENLKSDMWADTFQILQHAILGKLIEVNVPYYKRYHKNNTHTKWISTNNDILNFYFSIYMISKKYFTSSEICSNIINKRLEQQQINLDDKIKKTFDYIVMGGGIQGCCSALYLNKQGFNVCIIDKNSSLMSGASSNNEGKIHLGFVYSNDKTFGTAEKMLIDALNFSNSINYLLEININWDEIKSNKFLYLVPKTSLVKEHDLDIFFEKIQNLYNKLISENQELNYLGNKPKMLYKKINIPENFNKEFFDCCYETEECSINLHILNKKIIDVMIKNNIEIVLENNIECIKTFDNYFEIVTDKQIFYSNKIVNCLWENKTKIDNFVLEKKCNDTNYRYKFGIISKKIKILEDEQSITIVNGPFGDFVNFTDYMYFSWYPYSMKGFCCSDEPPNDWNIDNLINNKEDFLLSHTEIFNYIFGKQFNFIEPKIIGGIIVANGFTDINEIDSKLHERNDERIIKYKKNYFTITTGKFTSAPYNSLLLKNFI